MKLKFAIPFSFICIFLSSLVFSNEALKSTYEQDVDADRKKDIFTFTIQRDTQSYGSSPYRVDDIDTISFKKEHKNKYNLINAILAKYSVNLYDDALPNLELLTGAINELITIPNLIELLDNNKGISDAQSGTIDEATIVANKKKMLEIYPHTLMRQYYQAKLTIINSKKEILWNHEWKISESDMEELITEDQRKNLKDWATNYFKGFVWRENNNFKWIKLEPKDINNELIEYYSKVESISPDKIKKSILAEKSNATLWYRASWREELYCIVYVPILKKFIAYSGYGD